MYIPNFIEIEETFCGRTYGRTDGPAYGHLRPTLLGRLGGVDLTRIFAVLYCANYGQLTTVSLHSVITTTPFLPFPRYYHFYSVSDCLLHSEVLHFRKNS